MQVKAKSPRSMQLHITARRACLFIKRDRLAATHCMYQVGPRLLQFETRLSIRHSMRGWVGVIPSDDSRYCYTVSIHCYIFPERKYLTSGSPIRMQHILFCLHFAPVVIIKTASALATACAGVLCYGPVRDRPARKIRVECRVSAIKIYTYAEPLAFREQSNVKSLPRGYILVSYLKSQLSFACKLIIAPVFCYVNSSTTSQG